MARNETCIKTAGEAVPVNGQPMHKIGTASWQVTDASRRFLSNNNPKIKVGASYANVNDYTLSLLTGRVTFHANVPSATATVKFYGEYKPLVHVAGAHKFTFNSERASQNVTEFADLDPVVIGVNSIPATVHHLGRQDIKVSLESFVKVSNPLWMIAMIDGNQVVLELVEENGDSKIGLFEVVSDNNNGSGDGLLTTESVSFALAGAMEVKLSTKLRIIGDALNATYVGHAYSFIPAVSGGVAATVFSIQNKPSWMAFDTATGELSGTLSGGEEATYANIIISVTDGISSADLAGFDIVATTLSANPIAVDDAFDVNINTTTLFDVLVNDNSGTGTATLVSIDAVSGGTAQIVDGEIEFTSSDVADAGFIQYTMSDGAGLESSATATVNITVPPPIAWRILITADDVQDNIWNAVATNEISGLPYRALPQSIVTFESPGGSGNFSQKKISAPFSALPFYVGSRSYGDVEMPETFTIKGDTHPVRSPTGFTLHTSPDTTTGHDGTWTEIASFSGLVWTAREVKTFTIP